MNEQIDKTLFFNECIRILQITPNRRTEEEIQELLEFASGIKFFQSLQEQNAEMVRKCVQVLSQRVIKRNEVGDYGSLFYIILKGSVGINIKLPNLEDEDKFDLKEVNILKSGASFGELALLNDVKRTATIIAKEDCVFAVIDKQNYKSILGAQELAKIQHKIAFLCQFPFFQNWSFREIKTISYHFTPLTVTLNQPIIRQNEICNHFYVVHEGEFEVQYTVRPSDPAKAKHMNLIHNICRLGPGEFFGEEAFYLENEGQFSIKANSSPLFAQKWGKTQYNVICRTEIGTVYKITREDIQKRFWESKTQIVFLKLLGAIHEFRTSKAEFFSTELETKIKQIKTDNTLHQFTKPFKQMQVKKFNLMVHRKSESQKEDREYNFYKKQENQAIEQFKKLFKDRNCSHAQVRTFFDQKTIQSQNYITKNSYYRLFFRFQSNKQSCSKLLLKTQTTNKTEISDKIVEPQIPVVLHNKTSIKKLKLRILGTDESNKDNSHMRTDIRSCSPMSVRSSYLLTRPSLNSIRQKIKTNKLI